MRKPLQWFIDRIGTVVYRTNHIGIVWSFHVTNYETARQLFHYESEGLVQYRDIP
jgi:hypothetical protein